MERFKRVAIIEPTYWIPDSPVELIRGAILIDNQTQKTVLQLKICNNSQKCIKSVHLTIESFDETNEALSENNKTDFIYQDLDQSPHSFFGDQVPIELPDKRIRKVNVQFIKVMFVDDSIGEISNNHLEIPEGKYISDLSLDIRGELYRLISDNPTSPMVYIPEDNINGFWRCTCGKLNSEKSQNCVRCNRDKNSQFKIINFEFLEASFNKYKSEIENNRILNERQKKEIGKRNKARLKRIISILIPSIFIIIVVYLCFSNFILPAMQYANANSLLSSGKYNDAKSCFTNLGNYNNSKALINECDYQQAKYYKKQGSYIKAIKIFEELKSYKDSMQLTNETKYLYANDLYKNKKYSNAIDLFTKLGNYKNSQQQIIECKYADAKEYMENKSFDKAASIFIQLDSYKNSKDLLAECNYQSAISTYNNAITQNDTFIINSAIETLEKLGDYKDTKIKIAQAKKALKWAGEWVIIKEVSYKNGTTETNTYGPYCNNEFLSKDSFPTVNIAYKDQKINDGFSSIQPDTAFTEKNDSLTFTGFGQIKYVLTKESDKILIVKGYYYDGSPAYVYKAIRKDDINNIRP